MVCAGDVILKRGNERDPSNMVRVKQTSGRLGEVFREQTSQVEKYDMRNII